MKRHIYLILFILALGALQLLHEQGSVFAQNASVTTGKDGDSFWTVRLNSFQNADYAWDFMRLLTKAGLNPALVRLYDSRGTLWRVVQVGEYPTQKRAQAYALRVKKQLGLDYLVREMKYSMLEERRASSKKTPLPVNPMVISSSGRGKPDKIKSSGKDPQPPQNKYPLVGASEEFFYELDQKDVLRAVSKRQRNVILARIMMRRGYVYEGIRLYEKLVKLYPEDLELREEYIGVLLDNDEFEKADKLLKAWLYESPDSPRALRQDARLRLLTGEYDQQQDNLGYLLRLRPGDTDSISSRAYSRQAGGDWLGAITSFSELIDKEPDNVDARRALSGLLWQRRPRFDFNPSVYLQPNETITTTMGGAFSMQLSHLTRGEAYYTNTRIYRPEGDGIEKIDRDVNQLAFLFKRDLSRTFTGIMGIGAYEGTASGVSGALGFDWRIHEPGIFSTMIDYNNPWLDEPSAANYQGRYNQFSMTYNGFYDDTWGLFLNGQYRQYTVESDRLYGHRGVLNAILTRRILADPDLFVSYSFYRSKFKYDDSTYTPIDIVPNEAIHTISASFSSPLSYNIFFEGAGGVRADEFKITLSYFGGPAFTVRLGHFEFRTGYEYSSDSGQVGGGETHLIRGGFSFVF